MITPEAAFSLLEKHDLHPDIIRHCQGVSRVAHSMALHIETRRPGIGVDPGKVRVAALLHDIGRARNGSHEHRSVRILRAEGLDEIADIIMHGLVYEKTLLQGRDDRSLLPRTLDQKIVCYADLRFGQVPMTLRERFDDALERNKANEEEVRIIRNGEARMFRLEAELLDLAGPEWEEKRK